MTYKAIPSGIGQKKKKKKSSGEDWRGTCGRKQR